MPVAAQEPEDSDKLWKNHCNAAEQVNSGRCLNNVAEGSNTFEFLDTSMETLYYRYGFKPTAALPPQSSGLTYSEVSRFLGDLDWVERSALDRGLLVRDFQDNVSSFLGYISRARKLEDVPEELYELRQEGVTALRPSPIQLRWESIGGTRYYFLTPKAPLPKGTLESIVLRSAASAMEMLRRDCTTLEQVALNLAARGVAFNTFVRDVPPISHPARADAQPYRGLGFRPPDFQPQATDYAGYEAVRNRIFCSGRGRAALMMGGVIARLARDAVSPQSVCCGPTKDVSAHGQCIWDGQPSSPAYWDDVLTAEEVDIICGVYEVGTGQADSHRDGHQTRCVSWWPTPTSWKYADLNMGYWTPACEIWFQGHLSKIRAGTAQLHSNQQWRESLPQAKPRSHLPHSNDRLVEEFLAVNGTRIARDPHAQQFPKAIRNSDSGLQRSPNEFYFALRTQDPDSAANGQETDDLLPPTEPTSQPRQAPKPEVQNATRQYWDARRNISSALLRARVIEQRLQTLRVKSPDDVYLSASELGHRRGKIEAELVEERRRVRGAASIVDDIRRECKTPTIVPGLLEALIQG